MNRTALSINCAFLLLLFGVGIVQAAVELRQGDWPQALDIFSEPPSAQHLRVYEKDLENSSFLAQQIRPWVQFTQFRLFHDLGEKAIFGKEGWLFYRPDVQYLIQPLPDLGAVTAIQAFHDALAERGIQLLLMPVPGKPSVYPGKLTGRAENPSATVSANTLNAIHALRNQGIEVLDLYALFQKPSDTPSYLVQDTHWSPSGMRHAAEAAAQRLLELGWTTPGNTPFDIKPAPITRQGDVLRMIQAPSIERAFEAQNVPCEQVIDPQTGKPYADDPASEILVLGDSFLRIYERDEPGSAGFIAHLARALGRPVASIVNDGGASTLVRQELARRPELLHNKKIVLWEFVERDLRFGTEGWQIVPLPKLAAVPAP